jgi:hypothetical protein
MTQTEARIEQLSESLVDEIVGAVALPKTPFTHRIGWRLFRGICRRLAEIAVPFDDIVGNDGLPQGSKWMLTHFCDQINAFGVENIPQSGPLLVVTNHPGSYDGMVLFSQLPRKDIRWISSEIPFLRLLPNLQGNLFFSSREDTRDRMVVLRNCIKQLQTGGVLVYFAAGHRDPDPAIYPGASRAIDGWLDIFDVFYKYVPELQTMPVIMSGVVDKFWSKHPLTWLRRKQIDQQRLAEFGQVITQLVRPGMLMLSPNITFGQAHTESDLRAGSPDGTLRAAIIGKGKQLLQEHCERFGGNPV